jgi:hypothetical protein
MGISHPFFLPGYLGTSLSNDLDVPALLEDGRGCCNVFLVQIKGPACVEFLHFDWLVHGGSAHPPILRSYQCWRNWPMGPGMLPDDFPVALKDGWTNHAHALTSVLVAPHGTCQFLLCLICDSDAAFDFQYLCAQLWSTLPTPCQSHL